MTIKIIYAYLLPALFFVINDSVAEDFYLADREHFEKALTNFYGSGDKNRAKEAYTLDEIKKKELSDDLFNIEYLLGVNLDQGLSFVGLEEYGIEVVDKNTVKINKSKYPGWFRIDSLVYPLKNEEYLEHYYENKLKSIGFNKEDLKKIRSGLNEISIHDKMLSIDSTLLEMYAPLICDKNISHKDKLNAAKEMLYESKKYQYEIKRQNSVDVLKILNAEKQMELIKVMQESNHTTTYIATEYNEEAKNIIKKIHNGEYAEFYPKCSIK